MRFNEKHSPLPDYQQPQSFLQGRWEQQAKTKGLRCFISKWMRWEMSTWDDGCDDWTQCCQKLPGWFAGWLTSLWPAVPIAQCSTDWHGEDLACSQEGCQDLLRLRVYVCVCICVHCQLAGACLPHLSKLAFKLLKKKKHFSNYIISQTKRNIEWNGFPAFSIWFIPKIFLLGKTHATLTCKRRKFDFWNDV